MTKTTYVYRQGRVTEKVAPKPRDKWVDGIDALNATSLDTGPILERLQSGAFRAWGEIYQRPLRGSSTVTLRPVCERLRHGQRVWLEVTSVGASEPGAVYVPVQIGNGVSVWADVRDLLQEDL